MHNRLQPPRATQKIHPLFDLPLPVSMNQFEVYLKLYRLNPNELTFFHHEQMLKFAGRFGRADVVKEVFPHAYAKDATDKEYLYHLCMAALARCNDMEGVWGVYQEAIKDPSFEYKVLFPLEVLKFMGRIQEPTELHVQHAIEAYNYGITLPPRFDLRKPLPLNALHNQMILTMGYYGHLDVALQIYNKLIESGVADHYTHSALLIAAGKNERMDIARMAYQNAQNIPNIDPLELHKMNIMMVGIASENGAKEDMDKARQNALTLVKQKFPFDLKLADEVQVAYEKGCRVLHQVLLAKMVKVQNRFYTLFEKVGATPSEHFSLFEQPESVKIPSRSHVSSQNINSFYSLFSPSETQQRKGLKDTRKQPEAAARKTIYRH